MYKDKNGLEIKNNDWVKFDGVIDLQMIEVAGHIYFANEHDDELVYYASFEKEVRYYKASKNSVRTEYTFTRLERITK